MGGAVFPPCCLTWGQTLVDIMKITGNLLQKAPSSHCCTQCPWPCSGPPLTHTSAGDSSTLSGKSGSVSVGSLPLSPGSWCTQVSVCALRESISLVPCKFWQLYGGVNGNLLQEGLCHTQVCCTQSLCPCGRPLLTLTSAGATQTQIWLSLCWVSGSWCTQSLSPPSVSRGYGVWFQMWLHPSYHLAGDSLPLDVRYLFLVRSNILLSTGVQQQVVISEFSQEKMSAHPSTLPSPSAMVQTP